MRWCSECPRLGGWNEAALLLEKWPLPSTSEHFVAKVAAAILAGDSQKVGEDGNLVEDQAQVGSHSLEAGSHILAAASHAAVAPNLEGHQNAAVQHRGAPGAGALPKGDRPRTLR